MTGLIIVAAKELRTGDRIEDGGSMGRLVKRAHSTVSGKVKVTWIDGWSDTFASDEAFQVRERGVAWVKS